MKTEGWPQAERPRERLARLGAEPLSILELLVLLLGSGRRGLDVRSLAEGVLASAPDLGALSRRDYWALKAVPGLGPAAAARLAAAFELGRRARAGEQLPRPPVLGPADVQRIIGPELAALSLEQLHVLLLDSRHALMGRQRLYQGSVNSTPVRVGELFSAAVSARCPAVVFVHNHPSGDPEPSAADWALTRAAVEAGRLLDIEVLDHIVIGRLGYVSLHERRPNWFAARLPGRRPAAQPRARNAA
jgi:DNA repair protein RadC